MRLTTVLAVLLLTPSAWAGDPAAAIGAARQSISGKQYDQAVKVLQDAVPDAANLAEPQRTQALAALHFYTAVAFNGMKNEAKTREELEQFLAFNPNAAKLDPAKYDAAFIRIFDEVRAGSTPQTSSSFEAAYPNYKTFRDEEPRPRPLDQWSDSPELTLLGTAEEKGAWKKLHDDLERKTFIDEFWKKRDLRVETDVNEFRRDFMRRVAFADQAFVTERTRGSMTDRGRVFVLLGPPRLVRYSPLSARDGGGVRKSAAPNQVMTDDPATNFARMAAAQDLTAEAARSTTPLTASKGRVETWGYAKDQLPKSLPESQVSFKFVTEEGYGENVLQRDYLVLKALHDATMTQ
jgi:GWxTD domain-containing protein